MVNLVHDSVSSLVHAVRKRLLIYLVLIIGSLVVAGPFIWMVSTSLKPLREVFQVPPQLIPNPIVWENYVRVWQAANFPRYFLNSIFVATTVTIGQLLTGSLAAFAFARMKFRGRDVFFYLVLGTMMIPSEILLVPNYVILNRLGWLNSYYALIVPFLAGALTIFILRQSFKTIPQDLEDAAIIDGCSRFRFFRSIVLPISTPAIAAASVFAFITNWNLYIWPLVVTRSDELRTIQVGLSAFKDAQTSGANTEWTLLMAASTLTLLPVIVIYLFAQNWITEGFTMSGIRG